MRFSATAPVPLMPTPTEPPPEAATEPATTTASICWCEAAVIRISFSAWTPESLI